MTDQWNVDKELVKNVARNARMDLSEEEMERFAKQLEDILQAFKEIDKVDTEKVNPSFHPQEIKNVLREDSVKEWKWNPLENTKHKEKGYFKGPKIV